MVDSKENYKFDLRITGLNLPHRIYRMEFRGILSLIRIHSNETDNLIFWQVELDGRDLVVKGFEKGNFIAPTIVSNVTVSNTLFSIVLRLFSL